MRFAQFAIVTALLSIGTEGRAQTDSPPPAPCTRYALRSNLSESHRALERALTLTTPHQSYQFRASSLNNTVCDGGYTFLDAWLSAQPDRAVDVLPVRASLVNNSTYPRSVNDGGAWDGVGLTLTASAGVRGQWKFLRAQIAPEAYHQQNQPFEYVRSDFVGRDEHANPYHPIDYPTRFGTQDFSTLSPGQSYVQAAYKNVAATFGTENLWIGSAQVYPILMSYTAPGFPHLRLGTQKALDLKIAHIEFQMLFGSMHESEYFDGASGNDSHYFGATMVTIEPKFIPGLYLSGIRAVHDSADATGHGPGFYLGRNISTFFGEDNLPSDNAIGVFLGRWVHPASGFEAFVEWSREDTSGGWLDVLREPDWTQAYALGVQKVFAKPERLTLLYGELIHLGESSPARAGRGFFSYYTHGVVTQGHTNRGQLLGAAIGPGSDAQLIGADIFSRSGRTGIRIERTRYDDDTYLRTFARRWGETRHDAEINLSASRLQFFGAFEVEAGVTLSRRYGRQFIPLFNEGRDLIENNWQMRVAGGWNPPW